MDDDDDGGKLPPSSFPQAYTFQTYILLGRADGVSVEHEHMVCLNTARFNVYIHYFITAR